jgi:hypothetical protein
MAKVDLIAEELRRQRKDLDELAEATSVRSDETAELLTKLEELRRRSEETQRKLGVNDHTRTPEKQ